MTTFVSNSLAWVLAEPNSNAIAFLTAADCCFASVLGETRAIACSFAVTPKKGPAGPTN
ncbi:hypothetical protein ACE1AT_23690 [Pelatocladus sp. BLCC-F211]|uniref:hypothetical protein n=1 Tax=Pelatocladus sp. BLCC-F211 TaxID=3342752 RepID=UPI0035B990D0